MSADQGLEPRVRIWLHGRLAERPDPYPILDAVLSQLPTTPQRRRRWLSLGLDTRGFSMFSALKFVAAAAIVTLFGGLLLTGILTTPQDDEVLPAAVTESPSPTATDESSVTADDFPTGLFVSAETGRVMLEFKKDGSGMTHSASFGTVTPLTYAVDGDVYTALKGPWDTVLGVALADIDQPSGPATYRWDYDGERLAFQSMGEDPSDRRVSLLQSNTFRAIEDPVAVMAASSDLDVGDPIRAWLAFVPAAEVGPDAFTSKTQYVRHVAAVPIAKGQPITPDVVEPAPVAD